jgi:hypothetical protein
MKLDNAAGAITIAETQRQQHETEINDKWDASLNALSSEDESRVTHVDLLEYIDQQSEAIRKASNKKLLGNIGVGLAFGVAFGGIGTGIHMLAPQMGEFFGSLRGKLGPHTGSGFPTESSGGKPPLPTVEQTPPTKPPLPTTGDTDHMTHGHEVKLWHGAATEHVLEKAYPGIKNPFARINELYDKLGKDGVFETKTSDGTWVPVHLTEHNPNNIWIMRDSGAVRLTSEAQAYLGSLDATEHTPSSDNVTSELPTVKAADNLVNMSDAIPANTVSSSEGWYKTFGELGRAGVIEIPPEKYGKLLKVAGPELAKLHYSDGTPVAYYQRFAHEWRMYKSPDGRLHEGAIRLLEKIARQGTYDKAA